MAGFNLGTDMSFDSSLGATSFSLAMPPVPEHNKVKIAFFPKDSPSFAIESGIIKNFNFGGSITDMVLGDIPFLSAIRKVNRYGEAGEVIARMQGGGGGEGIADAIAWAQDFFGLPKNPDTILGGTQLTREHWDSTDKPSFSIDMVIMASNTDESEKMMSDCSFLVASLYPHSISDLTINPPWFYVKQGKSAISLFIGKWFAADDLIMTKANVSFSKEVMSNGLPINAAISLSFISNEQVTSDTVLSWFKSPSSSVAASVGITNILGGTTPSIYY